MKLNNDWTFGHFLYYSCQFSFFGLLFSTLVQYSCSPKILDGYSLSVEPIPVIMEFDGFEPLKEPKEGIASIDIQKRIKGKVRIEADSSDHMWATLFYNSYTLLKWIWMLILYFFAARFFKNISNKDFFNPKNATYFSIIGFSSLIISGILFAFHYATLPILGEISAPHGIQFIRLDIITPLVIPGIASLVLSHIFKEATRIHEEQKLTV